MLRRKHRTELGLGTFWLEIFGAHKCGWQYGKAHYGFKANAGRVLPLGGTGTYELDELHLLKKVMRKRRMEDLGIQAQDLEDFIVDTLLRWNREYLRLASRIMTIT